MIFDRRRFLRSSAIWGLTPPLAMTLAASESKAFWWLAGIIAESLEAFLARTVVANTVRAGIGALSRASAARIAASEALMVERGYAARQALTGLYEESRLGNFVAEGAGEVASDVYKALRPGFGVVAGTGTPFSQPDVAMARFPNSDTPDDATPMFGASDLSSLRIMSHFVRNRNQFDDHLATVAVYPIEMLEYPEYDERWSNYRPAVFRSSSSDITIRSMDVGTPRARFVCKIKGSINGVTLYLDEEIPLPISLQQPAG